MNLALTFLSITVLSTGIRVRWKRNRDRARVGEEDWGKLEEASKAPAGALCIWLTHGHGPTRPCGPVCGLPGMACGFLHSPTLP